MNQLSKAARAYLAIVFVIGLLALLGQLYFIILNRAASVTETIARYFGFFTIECNILVTFCAGALLFNSRSALGRFLCRQTTLAAITVYIVIVGVVYNLVLRQLVILKGWESIINECLHVIVPVLFLVYWVLWAPKNNLKWNIGLWLIFPFVYAVYSMVRGAITGYYPYPFLNTNKLGSTHVLLNISALVLCFFIFSLLFVAAAKGLTAKKRATT